MLFSPPHLRQRLFKGDGAADLAHEFVGHVRLLTDKVLRVVYAKHEQKETRVYGLFLSNKGTSRNPTKLFIMEGIKMLMMSNKQYEP